MILEFGVYDFLKHSFYQMIQAIFFRNGVKTRINSIEIVFFDTGTRASNANSIAPIGKPKIEPSIRIDDLNVEFDFIKIDIEGSELVALQGALKTLHTTKFMTLEIHPALLEKLGQTPRDIFELLKQYNPQYFYLGRSTSPEILEKIEHQYEINIIFD